jgi:hypothetical protein
MMDEISAIDINKPALAMSHSKSDNNANNVNNAINKGIIVL